MNNIHSQFSQGEGTEAKLNVDSKPDLCISCRKNEPGEEDILCVMYRMNQNQESEFKCYAYEPKG